MRISKLTVSFIAIGFIFAIGLSALFLKNSEIIENQDTFSNSLDAQKSIEQLQQKVAVLAKDVDRQHLEYQSLKTELSKLGKQLNTQIETMATGKITSETSQLPLSESAQASENEIQTGLANKAELRELVMNLFEETIIQQHDAIQNQQNEQDELNKKAFVDPEQARQYSIDRTAEKLDLTEDQKIAYQQYIENYSSLNRESTQQIARDFDLSGDDPEKIQERVAEKLAQEEELAQQLEEDFVAILDANQEQVYRSLPENQKIVIGNRFFTESDF